MTRFLWTGESEYCICGHHVTDHETSQWPVSITQPPIVDKDPLEEEQEEGTGEITINQVFSSETTVINHVLRRPHT